MNSLPMRRRRFISIAAAAAGMPLLAGPATRAAPPLRVWRGVAMGADATLQIAHPDPVEADRLIALCLQEVDRLEQVFSLYRPDSALCQLNREGALQDPPADLLRLLSDSQRFAAITGGAFDVTVQPLWQLYAAHFEQQAADPAGPSSQAIAAVLARVGWQQVELESRHIRFGVPGMGITLNGIAQGYVTDRVVERLKQEGIVQALIDMGETRVLDSHPSGTPWQVGLADPAAPDRVLERVPLRDHAIATSGGYGTLFDPAGRFNHLFEPQTGHTSWRYRSVSVVAAEATTADALSTAFSVMPSDAVHRVAASLNVLAFVVGSDGNRRLISRTTA